MQDRKKDYYYKKAKEEHYRSRASYKLLQVVEKYHFIRNGDCVVDLGAAPGGWVQAAKKLVGTKGFVLGVDLKPVEPFPYRNVVTIIGDVTKEETLQEIEEILPRKADAVLSDASQKISGIWEVDHACQIDLAQHNLQIALRILKPSGKFFVKVFQGDLLADFIVKMRANFEVVRLVKPKASRQKSSEIFLLGMRPKQEPPNSE